MVDPGRERKTEDLLAGSSGDTDNLRAESGEGAEDSRATASHGTESPVTESGRVADSPTGSATSRAESINSSLSTPSGPTLNPPGATFGTSSSYPYVPPSFGSEAFPSVPSDTGNVANSGDSTTPARRGPDPLTLVAGLLALLVSAYALTNGAFWLPDVDLRWIVAGGAVGIGILMLAVSLRPRRK
ncbi:hypothetical protein GCM10012275_32400 [Longimycelium tulufanense]|uniref:Uncharacterized protein n=1 Tax=Longimycelium tulufanense TaxID=907463 RepID=A0A8J3CCG2_9PSEU|nr:hypothetical protein [Longimycelium tulufanense]GGM58753.1 hypothetical protein GCM10012275_32400 [Longimycelium tulufanense]